jgi:hypothetical protein
MGALMPESFTNLSAVIYLLGKIMTGIFDILKLRYQVKRERISK